MDVPRVGDSDPQALIDARDGDRDRTLERAQRNQLGRVGRDTVFLEIVERQAVPAGERPRDALRYRIPLVADRLGERSGAGAATCRREAVAWEELSRGDELGDEVRDRVEPCRSRSSRAVRGCPGAIAEVRGRT